MVYFSHMIKPTIVYITSNIHSTTASESFNWSGLHSELVCWSGINSRVYLHRSTFRVSICLWGRHFSLILHTTILSMASRTVTGSLGQARETVWPRAQGAGGVAWLAVKFGFSAWSCPVVSTCDHSLFPSPFPCPGCKEFPCFDLLFLYVLLEDWLIFGAGRFHAKTLRIVVTLDIIVILSTASMRPTYFSPIFPTDWHVHEGQICIGEGF